MAERDKMKISYETHGKQTNPCVILIHGLGLNKQMWQWIMSDLRNLIMLSHMTYMGIETLLILIRNHLYRFFQSKLQIC